MPFSSVVKFYGKCWVPRNQRKLIAPILAWSTGRQAFSRWKFQAAFLAVANCLAWSKTSGEWNGYGYGQSMPMVWSWLQMQPANRCHPFVHPNHIPSHPSQQSSCAIKPVVIIRNLLFCQRCCCRGYVAVDAADRSIWLLTGFYCCLPANCTR